MLAIAVTVNVFLLAGACFICGYVGFLFRSAQLKKERKKILSLENEMLSSHAEILAAQKEKVLLEQQLRESKIPVISITSKEEGTENTTSKRKAAPASRLAEKK